MQYASNEICENIAEIECAVVLCTHTHTLNGAPEFEFNVVLIHRIEQFENKTPKIHAKIHLMNSKCNGFKMNFIFLKSKTFITFRFQQDGSLCVC